MAKKRIAFSICLVLVLLITIFGGIKLHQHITQQRELDDAMERQERLNALYNTVSRGAFNPALDDDIMEIQQAVIAFAGLRSIGFSQEEVEEIWMSSENVRARNSPENHPDLKEIHDFLFIGVPGFRNTLNATYYTNFETISAQFSEFDLVATDNVNTLPLPVLHEVIRLWEAENPPQPRPTAETEP